MIVHYCCTLANPSGKARRQRNFSKWDEIGLPPDYVIGLHVESHKYLGIEKAEIAVAQYGCYQTHTFAWTRLIESEASFSLISEDDAYPIVGPQLLKEVHQITQSQDFRDKPCLIQMGHVIFSRLTPTKLLVCLYKSLKNFRSIKSGYSNQLGFGTHCYILNRKMAEVLIRFDPNGILGLDVVLMALSKSEFGSDLVFKRRVFPAALQERIDSSIPTNQEYYGTLKTRLSFSQYLSCFSDS